MSDIEEEDNELIKYSGNYGGIDQNSKFWDDLEDIGEKELLKMKIIKITVYTGFYKEKNAIFGISFTYINSATGEIKEIVHKGSLDYVDEKEFVIGHNEYLTDFYIKHPNEAEYISQIGYGTNKRKFLVPEKSDDGEEKNIESNGGKFYIVGTFGCINERLDASGVLFISKKDYWKLQFFIYFLLRHKSKKDTKFKEEWDNKNKCLPIEYQYIWKFINLPADSFPNIFNNIINFIKY